MFEIKLPDGSVRNCDKEITVLDFAKNLSISLAKKTVGAIFNNVQVDVTYTMKEAGELKLITIDSELGTNILRHSTTPVSYTHLTLPTICSV